MIGHPGHFSGHDRTFRTLFGHVSGHDTGHLPGMTGHVSGHDRTGSDSITCAHVQNVHFETGHPGHISDIPDIPDIIWTERPTFCGPHTQVGSIASFQPERVL